MACNGHQFNSIEDDVCQLVYVERAEVLKSEDVSVHHSYILRICCIQEYIYIRMYITYIYVYLYRYGYRYRYIWGKRGMKSDCNEYKVSF